MTPTVAELLARKQKLLERLQEEPRLNEQDEIARLLAWINAVLNRLDARCGTRRRLPAALAHDPIFPRPLLTRRRCRLAGIQRPHDPDPRHHRRAAVLGNEHQDFDGSTPFGRIVLALRQLGDEGSGVAQCDELSAAGQRD